MGRGAPFVCHPRAPPTLAGGPQDVISLMPGRLDAPVSEFGELSTGQR